MSTLTDLVTAIASTEQTTDSIITIIQAYLDSTENLELNINEILNGTSQQSYTDMLQTISSTKEQLVNATENLITTKELLRNLQTI